MISSYVRKSVKLCVLGSLFGAFVASQAALPPQYVPSPPQEGKQLSAFAIDFRAGRKKKTYNFFRKHMGSPILSVWLTSPSDDDLRIAEILSQTVKKHKRHALKGLLVLLGGKEWDLSKFKRFRSLHVGILSPESQIAEEFNLRQTKLNMTILVNRESEVIGTAVGLSSHWKPGIVGPYSGPLKKIKQLADEKLAP
jgi:hypothetical protein